jgi:hypothetical protein
VCSFTVWRWGINISQNASAQVLTQINFVRRNQHTNTILITVSNRFYLNDQPCISKEVKIYSRRLSKTRSHFDKESLVRTVSDKDLLTRYGLHMNIKEKEVMIRKLVVVTPEIVDEHKIGDPVSMVWKGDLIN